MSSVLSNHLVSHDHTVALPPEVLAIVAHELRNPIGAIRNACGLLESAGRLPQSLDQARRLIERQVGQLSVLVEDLMALPTLSQGTLRLRREWSDVVPEVEAAVESCGWAVRAAGHALRVDVPTSPVYACVDAPRLRQAITNLIDNACKYTGSFGHIRVSLQVVENCAVFTVRDNGAGIAREVLPHIFKMFERSAARSRAESPRGLGVGLALVREIARQHGGDVFATSAGPGCGSTFTLRMPVAIPSSSDAERTAEIVPLLPGAGKHNTVQPLMGPPVNVVRGGLASWQLKRALDYIKAHLGDSLPVAAIATVTNLSASHFNRSFKRSFGLPVHLYVMRRRIEMAQQMMVATSHSLGAIATACGMSDQSHLTRWFRRVVGETPNAWRRARLGPPQKRSQPVVKAPCA